MALRTPVVGQWYNVICPSCFSTVSFDCRSLGTYGIQCSSCKTVIDLRNPSEALDDDDVGQFPEGSQPAVQYSADVEDSDGLSATAQVSVLMSNLAAEQQRVMPSKMTGETTQAFSAQRNQALSEKFYFFHPITHVIEWLVFGSKPDARIGHVRVFRKKIPFYGYVNFPVPKTTTSYAAPCAYTFVSFLGVLWFQGIAGQDWMALWVRVESVLVVLFYVLLFKLAYSDPGYIRPGYVDRGDRLSDELTLKDIESNQRESIWESVDGVPMERKWCSTCEIHRPVRAAHCYLCGLCCLNHDHHCTVIGVCVGRRKVEMFACFVTVAALAVVLPSTLIICSLLNCREKLTSFQLLPSIVLLLPLLMFSVVLSMTTLSMWQSIITEATTRERIQDVYGAKRNPFSRGPVRNVLYHLLQRRVEPTLFDDEFVGKCALRYEKKELGIGKTVTCL